VVYEKEEGWDKLDINSDDPPFLSKEGNKREEDV
jgi:hypothetical protein